MIRKSLAALSFPAALVTPQIAQAAPALDGAAMSYLWDVPFVGLLLTIATGPLLFPKFWHAHYGKLATAWAAAVLIALAAAYGPSTAFAAFVHAMIAEFLSFIVLLFALYTVAGGILVTGKIRGTPLNLTILLAVGTSIASFVGTTGAAMILIRPLLRALEDRKHRAHAVVFFIILVANVGGALTPLGDPPLFVGFLRGVDFFWTMRNIWLQTLIVALPLLLAFFVLDKWLARDDKAARARKDPDLKVSIRGGINFALIAGIIACILGSALWKPAVSFDIFGTEVLLQNAVRDAALIVIAMLSLWLTPDEHRESNGFSWEPIREVAILFAAIFTAIIPVLAMLQAGRDGPFGFLFSVVVGRGGVPDEVAFFWLTGVLSAFLDNAPTYLVFFELAGGNAQELMGPLAGTLAAISMGAVYMGALTYIGSAPNFMVYAIAQERGIAMPSFFGYFLWASLILVPLFMLLTLLPVSPLLRM
jgi:Na+/H+ antiporter NhaD/arsenite permease-like protein